jgi:hypothetical protein
MKKAKTEGRATSSVVRLKFVKWLRDNDIEFDQDRSFSQKSIYYTCTFDNGTENPVELKIRFSDHPPGYYGYSVDIDTFTEKLTSFDSIISALERFGIVVEKGKYMGTNVAERWEQNASVYGAGYVKYEIPVQRGKPSYMSGVSGLAGIGRLFGPHKKR